MGGDRGEGEPPSFHRLETSVFTRFSFSGLKQPVDGSIKPLAACMGYQAVFNRLKASGVSQPVMTGHATILLPCVLPPPWYVRVMPKANATPL
jgi:hypothetical protein